MDLRQLEHFVAVADEMHFTRAAERLFISQSGLSASIRSLEKELAADLFIRNTRHMELTDAGRALLEESRRTLASAAAGRDAVAAVRGLHRGRLRVGTEQCLGIVDVTAELGRFHDAHPGVELQIQQTGSADLIEDVRVGRLDVAFVAEPGPAPEDVTFLRLASEPMQLVCRPDHPLAGRGPTAWDALADVDFVDFHPTWGSRRITDRGFAAAGIPRAVTSEVNDVHTLLDLVERGFGVAVVPAPIARKRPDVLAVVALPVDAPSWHVAIAVPSATITLAADTFLAPIRARFTDRDEERAG